MKKIRYFPGRIDKECPYCELPLKPVDDNKYDKFICSNCKELYINNKK